MQTIEQAFAELCAKHDVTAISVGMNLKQSERFRFDCTVWFDGYSKHSHGCVTEYGMTTAEAIAKALTGAAAERGVALTDAPALVLEAA